MWTALVPVLIVLVLNRPELDRPSARQVAPQVVRQVPVVANNLFRTLDETFRAAKLRELAAEDDGVVVLRNAEAEQQV